MDFSTYAIVRCNVEQKRQARKNTFQTWGAPLGFKEEEWVRRFETLETGAWAKGDRYENWALVPRSDPGTLDMLAHCETFRRPSLTMAPNASVPRYTVSYGIAGVFTPEQNRGHGYARQLLRLLHYIIAPTENLPRWPTEWGTGPEIDGFKDASFSVLYSGVGDKFYASCKRGNGDESLLGWEKAHVTSREWQVPSGVETKPPTGEEWGEWVSSDALHALELIASKSMENDLPKLNPDRHRVAILPEEALFQIHAVRNLQSPSYKASQNRHFGLILNPSLAAANGNGQEDPPFIVYTFPEAATVPQVLEIVYVQPPFPFEAVLAAARKEGCTSIRMWGGRGDWDDRNPSFDDSELPCLVVYDNPTQETDWEGREQYTWC